MRVVAVAIALLMVASCGGPAPAAPKASLGVKVDLSVPGAIRDAPLTDSHGHQTNLGEWTGKIVVLTDMLTLCQEICPLTSANFRQMADAVRIAGLTDKVEFLELTVDPKRDTAARLRAYQRLIGSAADWELLTATPQTIARIWKHFGVFFHTTPVIDTGVRDWWTHQPLTYDVDHSDTVVFLDAHNHERFIINAAPNTGGKSPPAALNRLLDAEGRTNLNHPGPTAWTVPQALGAISWLVGKDIAAQ